MNKLLQEAVEAIKRLPEERQTYLAEKMLIQADEEVAFLQAIDEGIDDADAGRFASAQEAQILRKKIQSKANAA